MVAFTIILRSLVEVVLQRFQRRDHLIGIDTARILDRGEHGAYTAIAERTVVGRQLAVIHLLERLVERLGGGELVLDTPIERTSADHALERLPPGRQPARIREQRRDDLRGLFDAEVGRLLHNDLLITAEVADAENIWLQRLDPRPQRREVGCAERMTDIAEVLDVEGLTDLQEAADHFMTVGIV